MRGTEDLKNRKVLVFGAGRSGIGSVELLLAAGACPVLYDGNKNLKEAEVREKLPEQAADTPVVLGDLPDELLASVSLCVISPGVPTDLPDVMRIREAGIPLWGEVELAYRCGEGEVLAVTGTNGKTTTVTLLGELMKRFHGEKDVFVVGNIGTPYTAAAPEMTEHSVSVAEISSFQLETIERFHPHVSAVTNITPDHLNRHHTMAEYIRCKERIAENQGRGDVIVLNHEDGELRRFGTALEERFRAGEEVPRVQWFSCGETLEEGMFLEDGVLRVRFDGAVRDVVRTDELGILGRHNYENVCTAVLCALAVSMPLDQIREVLLAFRGVEHRIEFVDEVNGVAYYNDSKGTNPDAAIRAVLAMVRPTVLIGGGYDKDSSYDEWIESFHGRVKALVLIGATKEKIAACAKAHGFGPVYLCETFREAFEKCAALAQSGDAVLLSPACASWGMFRDYEERGRVFKELVGELK